MSPRYLPLLLLVCTLRAFAHTGDDAPAAASLLDCEHPPKNLVRALPKEIAPAATVTCSPTAQMIVAKDGWVWRFPGSFFDRPSIPAYSPKASRPEAGGTYFTGFQAKELTTGEIRKLHETFTKSLATYSDASPPQRIVKLVAHNSQGHSMDAYFGFKSPGEGWVALCAPDCAPEFYFLINRQ